MFTHTFVSSTVSRASSREYLHPNDSNNVNGISGSYEKLPSESGTQSDSASTGYSTGSVTSMTSISPVPSPQGTLTRPRRPRPRSAMADSTFRGDKSLDGYHNGPIPVDLIAKAVKEFDSLRWCYEQNQRQYMEVVGKLQETQTELSKLKRASRFLVDDYETIQTQLEVQESCRIEAERYAAKMVQENKVLKRVSQGFLLEHGGKVPINENRNEPTEISQLNSRISALTAIVGKLRSDLTVANDRAHCAEKEAREFKEKYQEERAEHDEAKIRVSSLEEVVKKFKRVSTMVVEEYEDLQQTLEVEKGCRIQAEDYAYKIRKERNALRHKSAILEGGVTMDDRLITALDRVDSLSKTLEQERHQFKQKIRRLEEELTDVERVEKVRTLEEQLEKSGDTGKVDRLQTSVVMATEESSQMERRASEAETKVKELEKEMFGNILGKKRPAGLPKKDDPRNAAMAEMMERIKKGNIALRKTGLIQKDKPTAIVDLQSMLKKTTPRRRPSKLFTIDENMDEATKQFMNTMSRRRALTDKQTGGKQKNGEDKTQSSSAALAKSRF
ncbi:hypothetical protein Bbelb_412480 [Branchiostoma belcheri]|nr:hypothetical protein Bbelb_412480 [Branchiostoma belcheri]